MNYLIFGRGANTGDIGIGAAMLQDIKVNDPDASFIYYTDRPEAYAKLPELRGHVVEPFDDISLDSIPAHWSRYRRALAFAARIIALRWRPSLLFQSDPKLRRIAKHFEWADVLIRQGGPGWNDWVLGRKILRVRMAYGALALHYNIPMVMYAQSFGPFEWNGPKGVCKRFITRFMLNRTHLLTLRDLYSRKALERLGVSRPRIVEAADAAWNLSPASADEARHRFEYDGISNNHQPTIGLTLRSFHGNYGISRARERELIDEFAQFCDTVAEEIGELVFLSTDYRDHGRRNDLEFMRLVQNHMRNGSSVHVIDERLAPAELKAMYAEMDVLVSVRLHPGIFAMASGVPTILIGYDPKCADAAEQMQMHRWHIDIQGFTASIGSERLRAMLDNRSELVEATKRRADEIKERSLRSARALRELCREIQQA